ncbi:hypothetical protein [Sphingomonas sp. IC081]|uniref:hypothetical protein n=1 Tax=Sphingomonas sp. IC081 TaxID=304378 RepID=UPI00163BD65C|nr:hypothetical protein [Sphingomonas sp. IC081]
MSGAKALVIGTAMRPQPPEEGGAAGASSVLEVALEHGYESPSAYAAMFRRTLKLSPTAYVTARSK